MSPVDIVDPVGPGGPVGPVDPWRDLDVLLAAIPAGRWTSYGEIAEILGTGARAVGTRLARHGGTNAHRVLRADGSVSSGFAWGDPSETRTVREVLEAEGVPFGVGGRAASSRRVGAADLEDLLDVARSFGGVRHDAGIDE